MRLLATFTALAPLAVTAACSFDPQGAAVGLSERLHDRATLAVDPASQLDVTAIARDTSAPLTPTITGGELVARTTDDGYLLIEKMRLPLADVTVPAGLLGPEPVTFTELTVRLGTQLAVPVADPLADTIVGVGRADLVLDWAMIQGGEVLPLGMRKVSRAPFSVAVAGGDDGPLTVSLTTAVDGPAVQVLEVYQLRDLRLDVVGATR